MQKISAGVFKNFSRFFFLLGTLCAFFSLFAVAEKKADTFFLFFLFGFFAIYSGVSTLRTSRHFSIQFTDDTLTICRKSSMWTKKKESSWIHGYPMATGSFAQILSFSLRFPPMTLHAAFPHPLQNCRLLWNIIIPTMALFLLTAKSCFS